MCVFQETSKFPSSNSIARENESNVTGGFTSKRILGWYHRLGPRKWNFLRGGERLMTGLSPLFVNTRTHAARRSSVGVCDSEVMFVASCRLIQGAIRVKVHRIDVHMRQRPVSLSPFPPFFPFSRAESRSTMSPRHSLRTFRETFPNFFHLPLELEGKEARSPISQKCARYSRRRNNDSSRIYNI